jgi:hypothetical protein
MKISPLRHFIALLIIFAPAFALSQDEPDIIKDLEKKTWGIAASFKLNDHLGIFQVNLNDTTFELVALDNKMQILWRNQFKGNGVACGKFKGNILAIADSGYSRKSGIVDPYYAYLIDPLSGKTVLQKEIFRQEAKHKVIANPIFADDGSDFSLIMRQTNRKLSMFLSFKDNTEDLTIVNLNEKLEPTYLKLKFPSETFVSMTCNREGDLFVLTAKDDRTLVTRRYEHGATEPSAPLSQKCDSLADFDLFRGFNAITPSEDDRNVIYLAVAHSNLNDDRELLVGKFDFSAHATQSTGEVFTGKYIRGIEKSYIPVNDHFGEPNIGAQKRQLTVKYFKEHNGKLVTVIAESFFATLYNVTTYYEKAWIINCYDNDLKKKFQQLMPIYRESSEELTSGFEFEENVLKVVSNNGNGDTRPAYGQLDLVTGKWLKLEPPKADDGYHSDEHIIWFNDTFIVPFIRRPGIFGNKYNIDLLRYDY